MFTLSIKLNNEKMKIMKHIAILLLVASTFTLKAQQDPLYTQYMFNLSSVNAAAIGRADYMSFMTVNRFQWVGFEGAPNTYSLTADVPLPKYNSGVGLSYFYDKVGPERSNNLYFDYAYHIKVAYGIKLGMGLKAGFKVFSADFSKIGQEGVEDEQFSKDVYGDLMPNFGLGLFAYRDDFYFGVSSPKMVNHKYEGTDDVSGGEERHFFIIGGYVYKINREITFKPSIHSKMVKGSPPSVDITANFLFREMIWGGLSYRTGDALAIITQVQIDNRFRLGYAYDITLSKMRKASSGSHEIMLTYDLIKTEDRPKISRFF
jgi:type IX secretion system PorP/SprF family membrane protein